MNKTISGFHKLTKQQKTNWIASNFLENTDLSRDYTEGGLFENLKTFQSDDADFQRIFDGFSENTLTNFPMPYGIAPNFLINNKVYAVPMVIEESSVVAAAASGAKYWSERGGFHAEVLGTVKVGCNAVRHWKIS